MESVPRGLHVITRPARIDVTRALPCFYQALRAMMWLRMGEARLADAASQHSHPHQADTTVRTALHLTFSNTGAYRTPAEITSPTMLGMPPSIPGGTATKGQ